MARETVHIDGLQALLARLLAFPVEMSKNGGPVRAAVRKAGNVIKAAEQANIRQIVADPNVGGDNRSTGVLEKSVKVTRARAPEKYKGETAFVLIPKRARYPVSEKTPSGIGVATVGAMLEYGTSKRRPMPWARPAFESKKDEAVRVMIEETEKGIARIEKKLGGT